LSDEIVDRTEDSVADVLGRLAPIAEAFERAYHQMVHAVMPPRLPMALCTIEDLCVSDPMFQYLTAPP
jgi:hypothetical protein